MAFRIAVVALAKACFLSAPKSVDAELTFFAFEDGGGFLSRSVAPRDDIHATIEVAIRGETGPADPSNRLVEMEDSLRPIFQSLERDRNGRLESNAVRYLLYRYFAHQRGWFMHWAVAENASFAVQSMELPEDVRDVVCRHLESRGLSLHETAVLAAMLEQQVFDNGVERLGKIWEAYGLGQDDTVDSSRIENIVDAQTLTYLNPKWWRNFQYIASSGASVLRIEQATRYVEEQYPGWDDTKAYLHDTIQKDLGDKAQGGGVSFGDTKGITQDVMEHFGRWQDQECRLLKAKLLSMETTRPGRVDLLTFYEAADEGWIFQERIDYLRILGALDESQPEHLAVVVPNYMTSATNYIGGSGDFDLACIDECDDLLRQIELQIGTPTATAKQLADVVANLPSPSDFSGSAGITPELLAKLANVSASQGGKVQLHGRLFALWLHHVYPRDCPYPHLGGTTEPQLRKDMFTARTGEHALMPRDIRLEVMEELRQAPTESCTALPWDTHEELVYTTAASQPATNRVFRLLPIAAFALWSIFGGLKDTMLVMARRARKSSKV